MYGLFYKSRKKFRKRKLHRHRKRIGSRSVEELTRNLVVDYKTPGFTFRLKSYIMRLPKYKVRVAAAVIHRLVVQNVLLIVLEVKYDLGYYLGSLIRIIFNMTTSPGGGVRDIINSTLHAPL